MNIKDTFMSIPYVKRKLDGPKVTRDEWYEFTKLLDQLLPVGDFTYNDKGLLVQATLKDPHVGHSNHWDMSGEGTDLYAQYDEQDSLGSINGLDFPIKDIVTTTLFKDLPSGYGEGTLISRAGYNELMSRVKFLLDTVKLDYKNQYQCELRGGDFVSSKSSYGGNHRYVSHYERDLSIDKSVIESLYRHIATKELHPDDTDSKIFELHKHKTEPTLIAGQYIGNREYFLKIQHESYDGGKTWKSYKLYSHRPTLSVVSKIKKFLGRV